MTATTTQDVHNDVDLFSDEALDNPYPHYERLRDAGPAVYLDALDVWFLGRYEQVRSVAVDWRTYTSSQGVGLNPMINSAWQNALVCLDPPAHTGQRRLFNERLAPRALRTVTETIDQRASTLADQLLERGEFDAVTDLAQDLPIHIIMDLIGWPEKGRDQLLEMASGTFDCTGPQNSRMMAGAARMQAMFGYLTDVVATGNLAPGSFGGTILDAHRRGEIPAEAAVGLLIGYAIAAFDTTISAIGSGMWLFATNPDQWDALRSDPSLVPSAFSEIVRMESPVQWSSRVTTRDVDLGEGVVIPAHGRVVHSYGSANRDERHYPRADRFDVRRNPLDHLGFGLGTHACVGQGLARLEGHAVFGALAARVNRIELAGEPVRALNNITRGFAHVPVRVS